MEEDVEWNCDAIEQVCFSRHFLIGDFCVELFGAVHHSQC